MTDFTTWIGIVVCIAHSGMFSGLNLAVFGIGTMRLQAQAATGDRDAAKLLSLRQDSNFLLATILWCNVASNVLLTMLADSALAGVFGFLFSTFVITFGGEIVPQAYFSRNAVRMASLLSPVLRFWQVVLYPISKPTALFLDAWLGKETAVLFRETELREAIKQHVEDPESEMSHVEGRGALNFLSLDDLNVAQKGEPVDPQSVIALPDDSGVPVLPAFQQAIDDPFLKTIDASGHKWVFFVSTNDEPLLALDADGFLRAAVFSEQPVCILEFCHRPIVVYDTGTPLEEVLTRLEVEKESIDDHVIDRDLILVWGKNKRVITGADILGHLMRGISQPKNVTE